MSDAVFSPLTRRQLLGSAAAAGLVLAGCGGSATGGGPKSTTTTAPNGARKRGGTFRFSPADFGGVNVTDPQASSDDYALEAAMWDPLMRVDHEFKPRLWLAEEFAPEGKDLRTWTIRVRDGVEFHNGKTLDADDVIYTLQRNLDPKNPGFIVGLLNALDPKAIKKLDKRTVRLGLKYPNSQLNLAFTYLPSGIVPVGFDPKHPVGTGPFKQQSFTPGQRWVGVRNENYWRNGEPYLDSLELLGFANPDVARVNALISGQIDGIDHVPLPQVAQLKARSDMTVIISPTGADEQIEMKMGPGDPFEDNRVRQAFKLMINRPQLLEEVYGGYGALGNDIGVYHQWDPAVDPGIPQREQDVDKARSLIKAAGKEGMQVSFRVGEVVPGQTQVGDILIQYAKAIGVTLTLDKLTDLSTFYGKAYYTSQLKNDYEYTITMYGCLNYNWLATAGFNNTGYDDPRVKKLYYEAIASTGTQYLDKMHEISRIFWDDGPWIVWGRHNIPDAYTTKFTGATQDSTGQGFNGYHWEEIALA